MNYNRRFYKSRVQKVQERLLKTYSQLSQQEVKTKHKKNKKEKQRRKKSQSTDLVFAIMCLQNENKSAQLLNNYSFIFDEPTKPKLSTRKFVKSAKINLNKYWSKLENIVSISSIVRNNKKKLRKLKIVNQQLLNNRVSPGNQQDMKNIKNDEIYGFVPAKFPVTTSNQKATYKTFFDETFYGDIIPTLMTSEAKMPFDTPCVIDKAYDNYNFYLNECRRQNVNLYNNNDNTLYMEQLNESLRRKGYKFTLADVERCSNELESMYYNGQYLEDEGYLVV
ncbi:CLUMA_CG019935, isoform A [Clunio marinus]|uniref:CLUMA_CG019935, isoform A n=1 Tax=Clunio marinus TaxID=568069 RepID=A0A1J1J375_9DIPT|nr:CLUMA_CG019935, isoform A [Clunio marinus]